MRTQEVVASLRSLLAEPHLDIGVERRRLDDLHRIWRSAPTCRGRTSSRGAVPRSASCGRRSATRRAEVSGPGGGLFSAAFFADDDGPVVAYVPVTSAPPSVPGRVEVVEVQRW